ncbi:MAG: hypothetical protein WA817_22190 [Candidatus Acidiferrum sp.]
MTVATVPQQSFLGKLTNAIYLDYVLKVLGVAGFVCAFLASWHTLGLGVKAGMLSSVAAWIVGSRFSKIYR